MKIIKQANGNVHITDQADNLLKILPGELTYIHIDPHNPDFLRFSLSPDEQIEEGAHMVKASEVTVPSNSDLQDLFAQLSADFFFKDGRARGGSAALANVASSATVVTLKASNPLRKTLSIFNDGGKMLFIKYGSGASLTSFTHRLEKEEEIIIDDYHGIVTGIWDDVEGFARVTEVTK